MWNIPNAGLPEIERPMKNWQVEDVDWFWLQSRERLEWDKLYK